MSTSNMFNENKIYIKDALNNGIDSTTINNILEKVANYNNSPKQLLTVVEIIASMKSKEKDLRSEGYLSELVRDNNTRIKSALINGISKEEIAINLLEKLDDKENKTNLCFVIKLISCMKKTELQLKNSKGKQKQLIKQ